MPTTKANREEVRKFIRQLYRFFEQGHEINFRKMAGLDGIIYKEEYPTEVVLNPRGQLFSAIVHEVMHYIHPDWCETQVLREESRIINLMSDRQIRNIIKKFAEAL